MSKRIANYLGYSTSLDSVEGNKGVWNLVDQFFYRRRGEWAVNFTVTGGTTATPGNGYQYHVFLSPGTLECTNGNATIDAFLVAGGGTASDSLSGGGGAGGIVYATGIPITSGQSYNVLVGAGGNAPNVSAPSATTGNNGADTTFTNDFTPSSYLISKGGGRAAAYGADNDSPGGSGGGASGSYGSGYGSGIQPTTPQPLSPIATSVTRYGNPGGPTVSSGNIGGGGGGAGTAGFLPTGNGGNGQPFPQFAYPLISPAVPEPIAPTLSAAIGPTGLFGGGGGAGARDGYTAGKGGPGGGGDGYNASPQESSSGIDGTGGGGGSGSYPYSPDENGDGGDGIVIVRIILI
jgi:hypothetical protein